MHARTMTLEAGKIIEPRRRILFPLGKQVMKLRQLRSKGINPPISDFPLDYIISFGECGDLNQASPFSKLIVAINERLTLSRDRDASLESKLRLEPMIYHYFDHTSLKISFPR